MPTPKYEMVKRWRSEHPERFKAHHKVFINLRNGNLSKKPCEICGEEKSQAHHEDYLKPLKIKWLCKKHHMEADIRARMNR